VAAVSGVLLYDPRCQESNSHTWNVGHLKMRALH